jgi:hypothetical protein
MGIRSAMYEAIPNLKPKFNGVYPENNSHQKFMDWVSAKPASTSIFAKIKRKVIGFFYPNSCENFM